MESQDSGVTELQRLRIPIPDLLTYLVVVADSFGENGRFVVYRVPRETADRMTWAEWRQVYDDLATEWKDRYGQLPKQPKTTTEYRILHYPNGKDAIPTIRRVHDIENTRWLVRLLESRGENPVVETRTVTTTDWQAAK